MPEDKIGEVRRVMPTIDLTDIKGISPMIGPKVPLTQCAVIRCDDNGHTFVHTQQTDPDTAEQVRATMHSRAHKQDWRTIQYGSEGLTAALTALGLVERT